MYIWKRVRFFFFKSCTVVVLICSFVQISIISRRQFVQTTGKKSFIFHESFYIVGYEVMTYQRELKRNKSDFWKQTLFLIVLYFVVLSCFLDRRKFFRLVPQLREEKTFYPSSQVFSRRRRRRRRRRWSEVWVEKTRHVKKLLQAFG